MRGDTAVYSGRCGSERYYRGTFCVVVLVVVPVVVALTVVVVVVLSEVVPWL